jgi:hypothetical protein
MVEASVVPNDQIVFAPLVPVVESGSFGECKNVVQERIGTRRRDAVDAKGEARRKE